MSDADDKANPDAAPPEATGDRRGLLKWIAGLAAGLAGAAAGLPILAYVLGPVVRPKSDEWLDVGHAEGFEEGETRLVDVQNPIRVPWDGDAGKLAMYVRRLGGDRFQVFSVNCTHLGCPVSWFPQSGLFLCPCHGGVYYADGSRASGPPPRGLYQYKNQVKDGRLWVRVGHLPTLGEPA